MLVHNGIITNYKHLKEYLVSVLFVRGGARGVSVTADPRTLGRTQQKEGYVFESETDTEVVAKLMKHEYERHIQVSAPASDHCE